MPAFIQSLECNKILHFFEDVKSSNSIKTISYILDQDGLIKDKWGKLGTVFQLMVALKSVQIGNL
tara:strand:+ start:179 stop:373 length:195 start_codon:yes stop_codon:yes gene_type:complete